MAINLSKLFEMQKALDSRIEKEHPRAINENRLDKKILALQVELGELANEWRGFKFWSKNQEPSRTILTTAWATEKNAVEFICADEDNCGERFDKSDVRLQDLFGEDCPVCKNGYLYAMREKNPLLEELVDCLHFILSIGLELGMTNVLHSGLSNKNVIKMFNMVFSNISKLNLTLEEQLEGIEIRLDYYDIFHSILGLGKSLGFTWEEIEQAYISKNTINHNRQDNGY